MQTIYLDISNKGVVPVVYAKQGDVGRKFEVVLTDSGLPYIPDNGSAFSVWYSGSGGEGNYTEIGNKSAFSVNRNKVTVEMISQMLSNDGDGFLSLSLNDAKGNQISTWNIPYICEYVPGADSEPAKSYYTAFSKAVSDLPYPDSSLSVSGKAADAAATGKALSKKASGEYGLGEMGKDNTKIQVGTDEDLKAKKNNGFWAYGSTDNTDLLPGVSSKYVKGITLGYSTGATTQLGVCNGNHTFIVRNLFENNWTDWDTLLNAIKGVPTTRKINGLPLTADIDLTAEKVGAAPFGFGLGLMGFTDGVTTGIECATPAEVDGRTANGFWAYKSDTTPLLTSDTTGAYSKYVAGITLAYGTGVATQIGFCNYKQPRWIVRSKFTSWSDWEWVNPPMITGVEYRTTERSGDLPVYVKRISQTVSQNYGSTTAMSELYVPHGVTNFNRCVRCTGMRSTYLLPLFDPTSGGSISINRFNSASIVVQVDKMVVPAGASFTFDFYYTKTA